MTKVKVFVYGRRRRRRRGYDNSVPDFRHGELKIAKQRAVCPMKNINMKFCLLNISLKMDLGVKKNMCVSSDPTDPNFLLRP